MPEAAIRRTHNTMAERKRTHNTMAERRRTHNTMAERKRTKRQTIVNKILREFIKIQLTS
jgi:hypothetical protein